MEELILVTSDNKLYLDFVITRWVANPDATVLVSNTKAHGYLKSSGITPQLIVADERFYSSYEDQSKWFYDTFMSKDSVLKSTRLDRNGLLVKEALGIDRLRFFAKRTTDIRSIIEYIKWDVAVVELDVFSSLPFAVIDSSNGRKCIVFVSNTINFLSWPEFNEIKDLYTKKGVSFVYAFDEYTEIKDHLVLMSDVISKNKFSDEGKKQLITILSDKFKLDPEKLNNAVLCGVIFDKRFEHQLLVRVKRQNDLGPTTFLFYPVDSRSEELLKHHISNAIITNDMATLLHTDTVISIGQYEEIFDICR